MGVSLDVSSPVFFFFLVCQKKLLTFSPFVASLHSVKGAEASKSLQQFV